MKIVIVTHYFLPHIGGIEILAYNQAKGLVKKGHQVSVISSKILEEPTEEIKEGIKIVRTNSINIFEKKWGIPYPIHSPNILIDLYKEIKKADIVYVHDVFYLAPFLGSIIAKLHKKPLVLMQHIKKVKDRRKIVNLIQDIVYLTYSQQVLKNAKKIITCNKEVKNWINLPEKTLFFENCVDNNLFKPTSKQNKIKLRKKYNLPINKKIVLFVGRFVEKKGYDKLFEARSEDYHILMVGDGEVAEYMKKDANVTIMKALPQEKLKEIYQLSDIFCLPSENEGFPLTILEAMASGLPIITSNNPGYRDYLDNEYTILINPNINEIRKSITNLLLNKRKMQKMQAYSVNTIKNHFSWEKNVNNLLKVYREVLAEHNKKLKAKK